MRTCLDRLEAAAIISPCDPEIVTPRIKRADRRPQGWDLSLEREDLDEADAAVLEQPPHAGSDGGKVVDDPSSEVHRLHPMPGAGCKERAGEVQLMQPRGAVVAPEPTKKPSVRPSAASAHLREALPTYDARLGGPVGEFFAAIAAAWRFTAAQRDRLAPVVETALNAGWTPSELAAFTGGSTNGVRNPYAVLAARLSSAELAARHRRLGATPACQPLLVGQCSSDTGTWDTDSARPAAQTAATRPYRAADLRPDLIRWQRCRPRAGRSRAPSHLAASPTGSVLQSPSYCGPPARA